MAEVQKSEDLLAPETAVLAVDFFLHSSIKTYHSVPSYVIINQNVLTTPLDL